MGQSSCDDRIIFKIYYEVEENGAEQGEKERGCGWLRTGVRETDFWIMWIYYFFEKANKNNS